MLIPRLRLFTPVIVGAALLATPAVAQSDVPQITVHTGDLNLASPAGAASLQRRIDRATRAVCTVSTGDPLHDRSLSKMCRRAALTRAQPQVDLALANARKHAVMTAAR